MHPYRHAVVQLVFLLYSYKVMWLNPNTIDWFVVSLGGNLVGHEIHHWVTSRPTHSTVHPPVGSDGKKLQAFVRGCIKIANNYGAEMAV